MVNRVPTFIEGFDGLVDGGLPEGFSSVLIGGAGTGKTIFGVEYLYRGAAQNNEPGIYATFQESAAKIRLQGELFGWKIEELEKKGLLNIVELDRSNEALAFKNLVAVVKKMGAKRLVIDSLSAMFCTVPIGKGKVGDYDLYKAYENIVPVPISGDIITRNRLDWFLEKIKVLGCTSVLIVEGRSQGGSESTAGIIEEDSRFLTDGVIQLNLVEALARRDITIRKMRCTKHELKPKVFEITNHGISIKESVKDKKLF